MNNLNLRVKGSKRGVTPVIATIILIAGTLVLALVVGAYTFGLFGSNVKQVTLTSANLYSGTASTLSTGTACTGTAQFAVALNNPGSGTDISSVVMSNAATGQGAGYFSVASNCQASSGSSSTSVAGGKVSTLTIYPSVAVTSGQTFNYVINFVNGQSISGSLVAQ